MDVSLSSQSDGGLAMDSGDVDDEENSPPSETSSHEWHKVSDSEDRHAFI